MATVDHLHPQQLRMFMTPREITSQYQVLDADREEHGVDWGTNQSSARNWERTGRSRRTAGQSNMHDPGQIHYGYGNGPYVRTPQDETDTQVWARKLKESRMDPDDYAEMRGGGGTGGSFDFEKAMERPSAPRMSSRESSSAWESFEVKEGSYLNRKLDEHNMAWSNRTSIHESVAREGVHSPVSLSVSQFGSQGKLSIVGGHHRIAAALDTRPDDYIPVTHAENISDAKRRPEYT